MLRIVAILLLLSAPANALNLGDADLENGYLVINVPVKDLAAELEVSDKSLIEQSDLLESKCRGGSPQKLETHFACANREIVDITLQHRGYCNGRFDKDGHLVSREWYKCQ